MSDSDEQNSPSKFSQHSAHNDEQPPSKNNKGNNSNRLPKRKNGSDDSDIIAAINSNHIAVTKKLDNLLKEQSFIAADVSSLKNDNVELQKQLQKNSNEIGTLHQGQSDMLMRLNDLEQKELYLHMEISGFNPDLVKPPADLKELVCNLFDSYKIEHASADIEKVLVRFIKRNETSLPIVTVIFSNIDEKVQIMKSKRLMDPHNAERIFFSHSLTPSNRNLFARARQVGRDLGIRYVFVANGRVYLREENATKGKCVKSVEELESFKKSFKKPNSSKSGNMQHSD